MKNFNIRLSAIGGFLLLVSIAFALAQHDSRKSGRAVEETAQLPTQPALPIAADISEIDWHQAPKKDQLDVVRGNDNPLNTEDDPAPAHPTKTLTTILCAKVRKPMRSLPLPARSPLGKRKRHLHCHLVHHLG